MLSWNKGLKNIKRIFIVAGLICVSFLTGTNLSAFNGPNSEWGKQGITENQVLDNLQDASVNFPVYLYFADITSQYLLGEEKPGLGSDDPVVFCRQIIDALIQGSSSGLAPTIPPATEIRAIYIDNKTAYVDLSREVAASHPGGILSELMTIYSIVNTLVLNVGGVDQVKILIGGQDAETLSGHIDIRFPLNADMLLIR